MPASDVPGTCWCYSVESALILPIPGTAVAASSRTAEIERGAETTGIIESPMEALNSLDDDRAEVEGCRRCVGAAG
jgi:hypothetical protein